MELYERASAVLPGGVTAAARANAALGRPFYVSRAEGAHVYDLDGRRFLEACMSNGATLLGHGHPGVVEAVQRALELGIACMSDGEPQVRLAERLAAPSPLRRAGALHHLRAPRPPGYAGPDRPRLHRPARDPHSRGTSTASTTPWPSTTRAAGDRGGALRPETERAWSPGAEAGVVLARFNDVDASAPGWPRHGDELAAVILEPINFDAGAILPPPGFLEVLREETTRRGIVLIFDEILSGYRTGPDCAQGHFGVTPGPVHARQGDRRRGAALGLRRAARDHVGRLAARQDRAHRHLQRPPDPGHRRPRLPGRDRGARTSSRTCSALHERLYAGLRAASAGRACRSGCRASAPASRLYFGLDPEAEVELVPAGRPARPRPADRLRARDARPRRLRQPGLAPRHQRRPHRAAGRPDLRRGRGERPRTG